METDYNKSVSCKRHSVDWAIEHGLFPNSAWVMADLQRRCTKQEVVEYIYKIYKELQKGE